MNLYEPSSTYFYTEGIDLLSATVKIIEMKHICMNHIITG
jgi:hypothetical protein